MKGQWEAGKKVADGVKEILRELRLTWEGAMELASDRRAWREVVGLRMEGRERVLGRILEV